MAYTPRGPAVDPAVIEAMREAQQGLNDAREQLEAAQASRDAAIAAAREAGMSMYGISKTLDLSLGAVRNALGVGYRQRPASADGQ